jgi:hypothetical protein
MSRQIENMRSLFITVGAVVFGLTVANAQTSSNASFTPARLSLARPQQCVTLRCEKYDALVFVHGIYGSTETFVNPRTHFNWPAAFPRSVNGRPIDVFLLDYHSALVGWSKQANPSFDELAVSVFEAMRPLRARAYRSIGFVAHSLGGNVVETYLLEVTDTLGHPQRAQNAYVITLATPVRGAQIADIADRLKSVLGMNDDLLRSLRSNNLYLRMSQQFSAGANEKADRNGCRPVDLYASYEERRTGPVLIVDPRNLGNNSIDRLVKSPVRYFPVNHVGISKPEGPKDPIYVWVLSRVQHEMDRLDMWDYRHPNLSGDLQLCDKIPLVPAPGDLGPRGNWF